jgi:hypothetical protein
VADAARLVPDARLLLDFMAEPFWITEEPEAHLLPHVRRVAEQFGVEVVAADVDDVGVLVLELRRPAGWDRQAAIVAGFALLGSFAEEMTYVLLAERPEEVVLETVTGMVADNHFAPHGHSVRLRLARA